MTVTQQISALRTVRTARRFITLVTVFAAILIACRVQRVTQIDNVTGNNKPAHNITQANHDT